jgi:hypothetical protein
MQTMGAIDNNQFNSEAAVFPLFVELTNADALWVFFLHLWYTSMDSNWIISFPRLVIIDITVLTLGRRLHQWH